MGRGTAQTSWDKTCNIHVIQVPEGEEKRGKLGKYPKE